MRHTSRPLTLVTVAVALAFALSGCSGGTNPVQGSGDIADLKEHAHSLAEEVHEETQESLTENEAGSEPLARISEIQDVGADTIRVVSHEALDDTARAELAEAVFLHGDNDLLATVIIADADGVESQHSSP